MRYSGIGLVSLAILATGCVQQPHNNVLLFGTDTKVALDVSSSATSGGAPQITLGYRRAEAVWMPLVVNEQVCDDEGNCRTITAKENDKPYVLEGKDYKTGGGQDSYSVLASFGAKFAGDATGAAAKAEGGLAQFFATGIAAQRLAANTSVVDALKVNNGEAAKAEAEKRKAEADVLRAQSSLTDSERKAIAEKQKEIAQSANVIATRIVATCGGPEAGATRWKAMVDKSGISVPGRSRILKETKNTDAIEVIASRSNFYQKFESNLSTACP